MPPPLYIRNDFSPEHLEAIADMVSNKAQARRLRAIAAVLKGASRNVAAEIGGMQRQTLRDWVQRFNAEGPPGLMSRKPSGRPTKLSAGQKQELIDLLLARDAKAKYNISRWRLSDVAEIIRERFGIQLNEISVGRILRSFGVIYDGSKWCRADNSDRTPIMAQCQLPNKVQTPLATVSPPPGIRRLSRENEDAVMG